MKKELNKIVEAVKQTYAPDGEMTEGDGWQLTVYDRGRIAPFIFVCSNEFFDRLDNYFTSKSGESRSMGFGETSIMELFEYILKNEDECWIVDTDVLNWNLQLGFARDFNDFYRSMPNELQAGLGSGEQFITNSKDFGNEMVTYLYVELNDHMS